MSVAIGMTSKIRPKGYLKGIAGALLRGLYSCVFGLYRVLVYLNKKRYYYLAVRWYSYGEQIKYLGMVIPYPRYTEVNYNEQRI